MWQSTLPLSSFSILGIPLLRKVQSNVSLENGTFTVTRDWWPIAPSGVRLPSPKMSKIDCFKERTSSGNSCPWACRFSNVLFSVQEGMRVGRVFSHKCNYLWIRCCVNPWSRTVPIFPLYKKTFLLAFSPNFQHIFNFPQSLYMIKYENSLRSNNVYLSIVICLC